MNKKAIAALFAVLAIVVFCGCGQGAANTPPQKAPEKAAKADQVTPVTVVDEKKDAPAKADADPAPGAAPAAEAAAPAVEEKEEPLPEIIAKVGDDTITGKDFQKKLDAIKKMGAAQGMMAGPTIEQKRQMLQSMIREKAVLALAKAQGMTASDEEVQKELETVKSKTTPEEFQKRLDAQGITADELSGLVRQSILVKKLAESKTKDIQISDEELNAAFERVKSSGRAERKEETSDVAHILVKVADGADDAAWNTAKEKIDAARKRITEAGEKFADVAKEVTDDPGSKDKGGLYTNVSKGKMVPEFEEKMLSTPVGQVSEPFKTKYGWHILTVTAKHAPGPVTMEEMKDDLKEQATRAKRSQALMQLMKEAEAGSKTEILYAPFAAPATPPIPPMPGAGAPPAPSAPPVPPAPPAPPAPNAATPPPAPETPSAPPAPPAPEGGEKK